MLDRQLTTEGFFYKHHQIVRNGIDDVTLKNFTNLEDDEARVSLMSNIPQIREFDPEISLKMADPTFSVGGKDLEKARQLKIEGNSAVQRDNWREALNFYTKSYLYMPSDNVEELTIIIANRSAALYHLKQYEFALMDIEVALSMNYPKELSFKILDRKARCYLALKWNKEAILAFQETIKALDIAKLPKEKCTKMQTDAQVMMEILNKSINLLKPKSRKAYDEAPLKTVQKKVIPLPPVAGKNHNVYRAATNGLNIESNEDEGRFAVATKDIDVGETIVVETAYCNVLLAEYAKSHCQNCFDRCIVPVACPKCANVIFCSENCKNVGMSFHKYECPILKMIWRSGCSITCHMALRIIIQKELSYFINLKPKLDDEIDGKYLSNDYARVYKLELNRKLRSKADYFQRTHMAVFLLNLLKKTDYLKSNEKMTLNEVETYIGGLILRNLQLLQFNAHEIFELQCPRPTAEKSVLRKDLGKSVFLGGGLYPTLALFNHSCNPSVVRYFQGTSVIVKAIKNIKQGEQISENYGPIFTTESYTERKMKLKDQYWFECNCIACIQKWPKFEEMDEGTMRFKCDAGNNCKNVVPVPIDCQEFMIQCGLCQKHTNILKGLKALQDTEMAQKIGKGYMEKGDYVKALEKFVDELKTYDSTLAPPFKDYHLCQQNIRRSLLTFGNVSII